MVFITFICSFTNLIKRENIMDAPKIKSKVLIISWLGIIYSCQPFQPQQVEINDGNVTVHKAICMLYPTEGNNASGKVTFTKTDSGMYVVAEVTGLSKGKHGFHIHQYGNCSVVDGTSAGGHFNPENKQHGSPSDKNRHVGDLGNISVMKDGDTAKLELLDTLLTFQGKHSIIGRSVIVHAGEDDLISQPTGNAGARVACGVIGIAE